MALRISKHPLAHHHLTTLRDRTTKPEAFRSAARRLAYLLVSEATSDLETSEAPIETPLEPFIGAQLAKPVVAVAVVRAGLGLMEAIIEMVPDVAVGYAVVQRNEETAEPIEYYTKFPDMTDATVLIPEPMLATGGSLAWAVDKVKEHGATDITAICVVVAPEGARAMEDRHPDVDIVTAALDRQLNESFYIMPGLGDMGDRLFGT